MAEEASWDAEDFVPPAPKVKSAWGEEEDQQNVKENWFDEDEEEKKPASDATIPKEPAAPKTKPKKGKEKGAANVAVGEDGTAITLTAQELEELQRASDFQAAMDTFGIEPSGSNDRLIEETFEALKTNLVEKLRKFQKHDSYSNFLSGLFMSLCLDLDSEHVRRFSKELTALAAEKHKSEKEREKQKQSKKKKPALSGKKGGGLLDDIVGDGAVVDSFVDVDEDDFM